MSDNAASRRVVRELEKLLKTSVTSEERKKIWIDVFEWIHEVCDDDEWAIFRKHLEEAIAKRSAH
jgi:hypothetical protein